MANCHFVTQHIINSLKQRITTFCCQISWQCFSSLQNVFYAIWLRAHIDL